MGKFINHYKNSPAEQRTFFGNISILSRGLNQGDRERYYRLLTNFDFIEDKVSLSGPPFNFGIESLIRDYNWLDDPDANQITDSDKPLRLDKVRVLKIIQSTLKLSSHCLAKDSNQLSSQLYGRLMYKQDCDIQKLLDQIRNRQKPWFRLITPSLSSVDSPEVSTLSGHHGAVNAIAIIPGTNNIISASSDYTLKVWNLLDGTEVLTLGSAKPKRNSVRRIMSAYEEDSLKSFIRTVGQYFFGMLNPNDPLVNSIRNIDLTVEDANLVFDYFANQKGDSKPETTYEFFRLLQRLCVDPGLERTIFWFRSNLGEPINKSTLDGHKESVNCVVVTLDGKLAISGSKDCSVRIWEIKTGREIVALVGHSKSVTCLAVTSDNKRIISGSEDNVIKVWDINQAVEIFSFTGHKGKVTRVSISRDEEYVISSGLGTELNEWELRVWDLQTGRQSFSLSGRGGSNVLLCPDSRSILATSEDHTLERLSLEAGISNRTISHYGNVPISELSVSLDSSRILTTDDNSILIIDIRSGEVLRTFDGHKQRVSALTVINERNQMLSGSEDNTLKLWDLNSVSEDLFVPMPRGHKHRVNGIEIIPKTHLAISYSQDDDLRVWDLENGEELFALLGHRMLTKAFAVSSDGKMAVSGCMQGTLKFWDLVTRKEIGTIRPENSHQILSLSISRNGRWLVSGSNDKNIRVWDLVNGRKHPELVGHGDHVNVLAITPDSQLLATGGLDRTIKIWELESGKLKMNLTGHEYGIDRLTLTPDGKKLISRSWDTAKMWDLLTGCELPSFGKNLNVEKILELSDGRWIAFSHSDELRACDWNDGLPLATLSLDSIEAYSVTEDARTIVIGDLRGSVHVMRLEGVNVASHG